MFENAKSAEHIMETANVFVPQFMAQQIYLLLLLRRLWDSLCLSV